MNISTVNNVGFGKLYAPQYMYFSREQINSFKDVRTKLERIPSNSKESYLERISNMGVDIYVEPSEDNDRLVIKAVKANVKNSKKIDSKVSDTQVVAIVKDDEFDPSCIMYCIDNFKKVNNTLRNAIIAGALAIATLICAALCNNIKKHKNNVQVPTIEVASDVAQIGKSAVRSLKIR